MNKYISDNETLCRDCGKHCQQQEQDSDNRAYCCLCLPMQFIFRSIGNWLCGNCAARQLQKMEADK